MPKERLDIMIDIETFSTDLNKGMVVSLAYVPFCLNSKDPDSVGSSVRGIRPQVFYFDITSSEAYGRIMSPDTVAWWLNQPYYRAFIEEHSRHAVKYKDAWTQFYNDIHALARRYHIYVWSRGIDFDFPLIESSLRDAGLMILPWKFWDKLDVRTLVNSVVSLGVFSPPPRPDSFPKHNPLYDCYQQIYEVKAAFRHIWESQTALMLLTEDQPQST